MPTSLYVQSQAPQETVYALNKLPNLERRTVLAALFKALVVSLVVFLIAEGIARWIIVSANPAESGNPRFDRKHALAQSIVNKSKGIVFLGDSYLSYAIYTDLIRVRLEQAGLKVPPSYNFGIEGGNLFNALFLLRTTLQQNKPKLIVVNVSPRNFNKTYFLKGDTSSKETLDPNLLHFRNAESHFRRCVFSQPNKPLEEVKCTIEHNSYLIRHLSFFKGELMKMGTTLFVPEKRRIPSVVAAATQEISPFGWTPAYRISSDSSAMKRFWTSRRIEILKKRKTFANFNWSDEKIRPVIDFCKKNNIPLMIVWLPQHPLDDNTFKQLNMPSPQKFSVLVSDYAKANGLIYLDLHDAESNTQHFYNADHLNVLGAVNISERIADELILKKALWYKPRNPKKRKTRNTSGRKGAQ